MSRTLTWPEDLPEGTIFVRHTRCKSTFAVDRLEDDIDAPLDGAGKLLCWACESDEAGTGFGFVPVTARRPEELLGVGTSWAPVPRWFLAGEGPRLSPQERVLILALWHWETLPKGPGYAYPLIGELAQAIGLSRRQTITIANGLVVRKLVSRERRGRGRNRYRVAALMISGGVVREPVRGAVDCTTRGEADRTAAGSDEAANTTPGDSGGAAGCTLEGAVDCTSGGAVDCTTRREVEDEKDQDESPLSWGHARRGTEEEHHLDVGDVDGEVEHDDDDEEVELSPEARAFEERWSARRATRGQLKAGPHGEAVRA